MRVMVDHRRGQTVPVELGGAAIGEAGGGEQGFQIALEPGAERLVEAPGGAGQGDSVR